MELLPRVRRKNGRSERMNIAMFLFAYTAIIYIIGVMVGRISVRLDRERGRDDGKRTS